MALYIGGIDRSQNRRKAPVSSPTAWTPFHLGDALLAYWDAEASSSLTLAGSNVTTWTDCKNGHAPTQAISGSKPLWSATGFNGRPAVIFDGVDDYLSILGTIPFPQGTDPCELWAITDFAAGNAVTSSIIGWGDGVNAVTNRALRRLGTGYANALFGNGTTNSVVTNATIVLTGKRILRARFEQAQGTVYVDGGNPATTIATLNSNTANNFALGQGILGANNYMKGAISAILVTTLLSTDQATQLTTFLKLRGDIV